MSSWLLVEDEPDLYDILMHLYEMYTTEVIAYTTGEDVLSWLDRISLTDNIQHNNLPIFGLIDIRLPGEINGIELARRLRLHPLLKHMPIVLMTAYRLSSKQEREAIKYSGANRLVYKPLPSFKKMWQMFSELT